MIRVFTNELLTVHGLVHKVFRRTPKFTVLEVHLLVTTGPWF